MIIGFDAKRIFFNRSGLGVYGRSTIDILSRYAPENNYVLFSPKRKAAVNYAVPKNINVVYPAGLMARFPSIWRSYCMGRDICRNGIEIYHGLSHELPAGIDRADVRSVITMHDLIFVRHPELYKLADRYIYKCKYRQSCAKADHIVAISEQTKADLIDFWNIEQSKITVVYQGCDPVFSLRASKEKLRQVRSRYNLPNEYILSVGTIEKRKNLMLAVKAIAENNMDVQIVVCGRHTPYADEIMEYAVSKGIERRIHMHHNVGFDDLPAIYQMASVFVYTSIFEGFGIPILEAMNSQTPVITSEGGVFTETGGNACLYVNPLSIDDMYYTLRSLLSDSNLRTNMITRGLVHAQNFSEPKIATNLMAVYKEVL